MSSRLYPRRRVGVRHFIQPKVNTSTTSVTFPFSSYPPAMNTVFATDVIAPATCVVVQFSCCHELVLGDQHT